MSNDILYVKYSNLHLLLNFDTSGFRAKIISYCIAGECYNHHVYTFQTMSDNISMKSELSYVKLSQMGLG